MRRTIALIGILLVACACSVRAYSAGAYSAAESTGGADAFATAVSEMRAELDSSFIVERSGVFVVAGNLTRREFDRFRQNTIEASANALWNDFFTARPAGPIRIYLFADETSYKKWVKQLTGSDPSSPFGFYMPQRQAMMMNIATGGGTLVHEITHALTDPDFPGCPTWLFEGLGSLFEQCTMTSDGHIRGRVNWRLPGLRKGGFIPLQKLIESTTAEFRGEKEALYYANARYLCFYLQERGLLTKFYAAFRDASKSGADHTGWKTFQKVVDQPPDEFEKAWHKWVDTLKWPE